MSVHLLTKSSHSHDCASGGVKEEERDVGGGEAWKRRGGRRGGGRGIEEEGAG